MYKESMFHPDLGNGSYVNPVISQDIPDPAVFRDGDTFYYCGSSGTYFPGLAIYRSKDLVNWQFVCHPAPNFNGNVWAPEIFKYKEKYYILFPADGTNYILVSDRIDGGWSEPIDLKVGHIDPGHCVYNGKRYLFVSGNYAVQLAEDGMSTIGELRQVLKPMQLPDSWDIEGHYTESPKLIEKDGWYYLYYADGGTGGPATAHCVMVARAKDPINGPWEFSPYNPLVHTWSRDEKWYCKGHGCMVDDVEGNWWILYHAYEKGYNNQGRKILLEPVVFTSDGWPVIAGGADAATPRKKPAGEALPATDSLSDDFKNGLNPLWLFKGTNDYKKAQAKNGILKLRAEGDTAGTSHPITMMPGDHAYYTETTLRCPPEGCEAGMILLYDEARFAALGWKDDMLTIYRIGNPLMRCRIQAQNLGIRMVNDHHYVAFYISEDGQPYRKLNYVLNVEAMSALAYDGFSSLRAGLFAAGAGQAEFGSFTYTAMK